MSASPGAGARGRKNPGKALNCNREPRQMMRAATLLLLLVFASAGRAHAQDEQLALEPSAVSPQQFAQLAYRGLIGNVLEAVPMDTEVRVNLQRTSAVVSSTLFGRSLAAVAGMSNPFLLLGGLFWGVWSAVNINPQEARTAFAGNSSAGGTAPKFTLAHRSPDTNDVSRIPSLKVAEVDATAFVRPPVFKVWLPQRSDARLR